jgi:uncharacterized protein
MGATHALRRRHEVDLFEADDRPGGHSNTVLVKRADGSDLAVDTGFIVHNTVNYPNLIRLFGELGVATQGSDMSFSVSCRRCGIEYSGHALWSQPRNLTNPRMLRLLAEITRFLATARRRLDGRHRTATVGDFIQKEGYSRAFRDHFLVPLTASIWSTAPGLALEFPAEYALRFFDNHGLLGFRRRQWRTVIGGSRRYVEQIVQPLGDRLHLSTPITRVHRDADGVALLTGAGVEHRFDAAVVATHPAHALAMLAEPTAAEREILGAITYVPSDAVLHTDARLLPRSHAVRASWNYLLDDCRNPDGAPTMTYYMNRLQRLNEPEHYCVTLNRGSQIDPARVIATIPYEHPLYTFDSVAAQARLPDISGTGNVVYAGAYHGHGFHEDGLAAGLRAAAALGAPW